MRVRVVDERHGLAGGGGDGPALTEEVDLMIGVDATAVATSWKLGGCWSGRRGLEELADLCGPKQCGG